MKGPHFVYDFPPEATDVVWTDDKWLIQRTGFRAYTLYKRFPDTNLWERWQPSRGSYAWFKSIRAAKAKIKELEA